MSKVEKNESKKNLNAKVQESKSNFVKPNHNSLNSSDDSILPASPAPKERGHLAHLSNIILSAPKNSASNSSIISTTSSPRITVQRDEFNRSVSPCQMIPSTNSEQLPIKDEDFAISNRISEQIDLKLATSKNPTCILELDMDGNVRYLSKNWEVIVGTKISKILRKSISNIIVGDDDNDKMIFENAVKKMVLEDVSYKIKFVTVTNDINDNLSSDDEQDGRITPTNSYLDLKKTNEGEKYDGNDRFDEVNKEAKGNIDIGEIDTNSTTSSELTTNGEFIELEGQGILIHDSRSQMPTHSMWILKPFKPIELNLKISQNLIDNLGFGAEIFESYLYNLTELGIIDENSVPTPKQILCHICEQNIPAWWLEKHTESCVVEHRTEEDLQACHDELIDQKDLISKIIDSINTLANSGSFSNSSSSSSLSNLNMKIGSDTVSDYKGLPLPLPYNSNESSPRLATHLLKKVSPNLPSKNSVLSSRRYPFKTLNILIDLCNEALSISPADLDVMNNEVKFSPNSEAAIKNVLNWNFMESSDPTIKLLIEDTTRLAKDKIDTIFRLISTLQYSEKIKRETDELVLKAVRETVKQIRDQSNEMLNEDMIDETSLNTDENAERTLSDSLSTIDQINSSDSKSVQNQTSMLHSPQPSRARSPPTNIFADSYLSNDTLPLYHTRLSSPLSIPYKKNSGSGSITPNEILLRGRTPTLSSRHNSNDLAEAVNDLELNSSKRSSKTSASVGSNPYSSPRRHLSPAPNYVSQTPMSSIQRNQVTRLSGQMNQLEYPNPNVNAASNTPFSSPYLIANDPYYSDSAERRKSSNENNSLSLELNNVKSFKPPLSPLLISTTPSSKSSTLSIKDYEVLKAISKGAFGSVYLAKRKLTGEYFAIKALKKSDMIAKNQVTNVKSERAVMMRQSDSPYVAQLYSSFQTKDYLFLVMEYLNGGDCASLIKMLGTLSDQWCKRYIAEVIVGVDDLHQKGIIHRDLKPDNLLIDSKGHIKLTDFGLSRMGIINRQTRHQRKNSNPDNAIDWLNANMNTNNSNTPTSGLALASVTSGSTNSSTNIHHNYHQKRRSSVTPFSLSPTVENSKIHGSDSTDFGSPITNFIDASNSKDKISSNQFIPPKGRSGSNTSSTGSPLIRPLIPRSSSETSFALVEEDANNSPLNIAHNISSLALYDPENSNQIKTFVGTPDYLAPETIEGVGQGEASDWWSLGCILFEFLFGYPPFHAGSPEIVFQNILSCKIDWPDLPIEEELKICSAEAKNLIIALLTLDPSERLGSNGADEIKNHPYFSQVNWDSLFEEEPQFIPEASDPTSTDYFDSRGADITNFPVDDSSGEDDDKERKDSNTIIKTTSLGSPSISEGSPGSVASLSSAAAHLKERRGSRLNDSNEFGSFQFRNLAVLEKANKDVINRLKNEHLEHRNSISSSSSDSLTQNKNRGFSFNNGSPFKRPISPSHNSPSRSQNHTPIRHERIDSNYSNYSSGDENVAIDSGRSSPNFVEQSSSSHPTSIIPSQPISSSNKSIKLLPSSHLQPQNSTLSQNSSSGSNTLSTSVTHQLQHRSSTPTLSKQLLARSLNDFSPSSSDTEDSKSSALLRVRKRRQSSRKLGSSFSSISSLNSGNLPASVNNINNNSGSNRSGSLKSTGSAGSGTTHHAEISYENSMNSPSTLHGIDVLLCEPIPIVRYSISKLLQQLGCIVVSVANGDELVRRVTGQVKFDVILSALKTPNLGAIDIVKLIKNTSSINSNTPFVAITSYAKDALQANVFDAVLEKPIGSKSLREVLVRFCYWRPDENEEVLVSDNEK